MRRAAHPTSNGRMRAFCMRKVNAALLLDIIRDQGLGWRPEPARDSGLAEANGSSRAGGLNGRPIDCESCPITPSSGAAHVLEGLCTAIQPIFSRGLDDDLLRDLGRNEIQMSTLR